VDYIICMKIFLNNTERDSFSLHYVERNSVTFRGYRYCHLFPNLASKPFTVQILFFYSAYLFVRVILFSYFRVEKSLKIGTCVRSRFCMSVSARRRSESVYCAESRVAATLAAGSYSVCGRRGASDGSGVAVTMTGVAGPFAAAAAELAGTKREVLADDGTGGGGGASWTDVCGATTETTLSATVL